MQVALSFEPFFQPLTSPPVFRVAARAIGTDIALDAKLVGCAQQAKPLEPFAD